MNTTTHVPQEQGLHLPGPVMSRLLGISLIEYYNLNHGLLVELTDTSGHKAYRMQLDEQNDPALLVKLNAAATLMLHFSARQVDELMKVGA